MVSISFPFNNRTERFLQVKTISGICFKLLLLNGNEIDVIPDNFQKLQNLSYLEINSNKLKSLPSYIFQLKKLKVLFAAGNNFSSITLNNDTNSTSNLEVLNLVGNQLSSLPSNIGKLNNLKKLNLYHY